MIYKLHKEIHHSKVIGLYLGVHELDAYLRFLEHRC